MKRSLLTIALVLLFGNAALAAINITEGHMDIGLGDEGTLELHAHTHEPVDEEYTPSEVVIVVPNTTAQARQSGTAWDFIGNSAGETCWILPESETAAETLGAPFVGISAGHIDSGVFVNDSITLTLTGVSGPGQFSLYDEDLTGPQVLMASSDGISAVDSITIGLEHGHGNFAFSQAGIYGITFQVSATDAATGTLVTDEATFTFNVVPEPATLSLLALGAVGFLRRRK